MSGKKSELKPARNPIPPSKQKGSLDSLLGKPLQRASATTESPQEQLYLLGERQRALAKKNPVQSNFHTFLTTCCYSKDEARAGEVRQFPDAPYIRDLCEDLITERVQIWDKARRVLASWIVCAFDLWIIGGGQDPRWLGEKTKEHPLGEPTLMLSTNNRSVIIMAQKLEGLHGSAWFMSDRVKVLYDEFEKRGFREQYWPEYPVIDWRFDSARASNGGQIFAVPHGREAGAGATLVHAEEVAFWTKARAAWMGIQPVLLGGGSLVALTTANSESWFSDVVSDRVDP